MSQILVVEDDPDIAQLIGHYLEKAGHTVEALSSGKAVMPTVRRNPPDLVVLDLMLPGLDGWEVCGRLRARHERLPVIMLTALGEESDRVRGLELGADDYVTKPFSPRELVLRVQSVLRRSRSAPDRYGAPDAGRLTGGPIELDLTAHRAFRADRELTLTTREFDLLAFFLAHPGQAFGRGELMEKVWGWTFGDQSTVTVHVRRLREKLEDNPADPQLLQTVWGVGYRFEAAP
jgi:two-component system, OmpR family, response regulator ResD